MVKSGLNGSDLHVGDYVLRLQRSKEDARQHLGLSQRELELLVWISAGLKKTDIAKQMGVATATADTFRRRAYAKLGVHTGSEAAAILTAYLSGATVEFIPPASPA